MSPLTGYPFSEKQTLLINKSEGDRDEETHSFSLMQKALEIEEILLNIFSFLTLPDLKSIFLTCKTWKIIASDDSLYPKIVINEEKWRKRIKNLTSLELDFKDAPVLDQAAIQAIAKDMFFLDLEKPEAGITIMTLPKGLTLRKITENIATKNQIRSIENNIFKNFKDVSIDKPCIVALSNSLLKGSRNLSFSKQEEFLQKKKCIMPELLAIVALNIFVSNSSDQNYQDFSSTRCKEKQENFPYFLSVSVMNSSGLLVDTAGNTYPTGYTGRYEGDVSCEAVGVVAMRKFLKETDREAISQ